MRNSDPISSRMLRFVAGWLGREPSVGEIGQGVLLRTLSSEPAEHSASLKAGKASRGSARSTYGPGAIAGARSFRRFGRGTSKGLILQGRGRIAARTGCHHCMARYAADPGLSCTGCTSKSRLSRGRAAPSLGSVSTTHCVSPAAYALRYYGQSSILPRDHATPSPDTGKRLL